MDRLKAFVMCAFCMCEHRRWSMERYHPRPKDDFGEEANPGLFYLNEAYENFTPLCDLSKKEFKSVVDDLIAERRLQKNANPQYPLYRVSPPRLISQMSKEELAELEAKHGAIPKPDSILGKIMTIDEATGELKEATEEEKAAFELEQERWKKMAPEERKIEREKMREKAQAEWKPLPALFTHPDKDFYE